MNRVCLTGRIANDLELRKTQSGKSFLDFGLAVRRDRKDANGEYQADFFRVSVWEHNAEYLNNYAKKGTQIAVMGRLSTNTFEGKDGKVTYTFVTADGVEILSYPKNKEDTSNFGGKASKSGESLSLQPDDLPFY